MSNDWKWLLEVDSRENPENEELARALAILGIPYEVKPLSYGDYRIWNCVFERKTVADFFMSCEKGRMYDQLTRLAGACSDAGEIPHVLIHGDLEIYIVERRKVTRNHITPQDFYTHLARVKVSAPDVSMFYLEEVNFPYMKCTNCKRVVDYWEMEDHPHDTYQYKPIVTKKKNKLRHLRNMLGVQAMFAREVRVYSNRAVYRSPKRYQRERDPLVLLMIQGMRLNITKAKSIREHYNGLDAMIRAAHDGSLKDISGIGDTTVEKFKALSNPNARFTTYGMTT